ncbi:hypothetical protein ACH5RR_030245 [Cinchona calisaya]|uniref:Uncharacterized protein n=1 Tax=Cinchona calisaya TaxID=153742 RepID=A0ABD2YVF4_9GENT
MPPLPSPKCQEQSLMVNLHTFSTTSPESCIPEFFATTKNLEKLGIRGKLGPIVQTNGKSGLFDCLLQLELLENLKLHNDDVTCKLKAPNRAQVSCKAEKVESEKHKS